MKTTVEQLGILTEKYQINQDAPLERPKSEFLDTILGWDFVVHEHGRVRVVDYCGNDTSIAEAARTSYGDGTKTVSDNKGLIRYLIENKHTSPVEQVQIKFHIKAPLFVARQWLRTRMASVNEVSARYSIMTSDVYYPELKFICHQSSDNKQGSGTPFSPEDAQKVLDLLTEVTNKSQKEYNALLEMDLARELARIGITLNTYTEWCWSIDAHNLFHFLRLRAHPHAQKEIRDYADLICDIVAGWLPIAYEAFENFILRSSTFSEAAMFYLQARIDDPYRVLTKPALMSRREKKAVDALFAAYDARKPRFLQRALTSITNQLCFYQDRH